ncbi:MAG: hypothetical protein K5984_05445 [Bacteroidales bacterium]|nr:hypothetical protein [Bacteroidales bacterium]
MLIDDFYEVVDRQDQEDGSVLFNVRLNPQCKVYEGHFPGEPIAPGVCNIEMMRECAELVAGKPLKLEEISLCRFLKLVTPSEVTQAQIKISLSPVLEAVLSSGGEDYVTLKAVVNG